MPTAPAFDPSKPFETVAPTFDPSQPFEPIHDIAEKAAEPSTLVDVAKSAAVGPAKTAIALGGQFGDAADLGGKVYEWFAQKLFGDDAAAAIRKSLADRAAGPSLAEAATRTVAGDTAADKIKELTAGSPQTPFGAAPTSQELREGIEKLTGPLYEPKTPAGKYAQAVTEFAPVALAGPGGVASNLVKGAVAPGVASEYLGQKVEGTALEPWARILGALGGGVAAAGSGKAAEALANRRSAGQAAETATQEGGTPIDRGAINRVAKNFEADDLTPAAVVQRQEQLGPEAMFLDMGRQLQGRAEAMAAQPGRQQNMVLNAVEDRTGPYGEATAQRIKNTLDENMGPTQNLVERENQINGLIDSHARPAYEKVMQDHPVVQVPDNITSRPAVAAAMKNATTLAKQYGEKLESPTETKTIISGPGYHIADDQAAPTQTSLRYWDYVKKDLDRRINSYMKSGGTSELNSADKADLGGLIDARNALRTHLDDVTNGAYRSARNIAAAKPQIKDAIDFGRSMFNSRILKEEVADHVDNLSIPEQAGVRAGARREVDRIIDTARNDGAAARRMLDTNENGAKIEYVFGPGARKAIEDRIAAEAQFQNATHNISQNSRTQVRSQLTKDTESGSVSQPPSTTLMGLAHAGLRSGRQFLGDMSLDRTRQGIGDLLTRKGEDIPALARILSDYNAAKGANAGPRIAPQSRALAATLASQFALPEYFGQRPK